MKIKLKENSSTILFKVHDDDQEFTRCDFAIVTITKKLVDRIFELKKARESVNAYEVLDFNGNTNFLNQDEFADDFNEKNISDEFADELYNFMDEEEEILQIEPIELDDIPMIRTEADIVHVSEYGIRFTAYMKHSGIKLSTEKISWEQIENMIF